MIGYDFEPREIRSFDIERERAPEVGQRVSRVWQPGTPPGEYVTEYGVGAWEVADVLAFSDRPDWVRVYVVLAEGASAPWEDEAVD